MIKKRKEPSLQVLPLPALSRMRCVAIVPARDEEASIGAVVKELLALPLREVLVVANGCSDDTAGAARDAGARVINYPRPLGHDVGRALGASRVDADAYLFMDADLVVPAAEMVPFLNAVAQGVDLAINDINSLVNDRARRHVVNVCKAFLNAAMGMPELAINSITAVPHCLSRQAVRTIGWQNLAIPPKALAIARREGLVIKAVAGVDVMSRNRVRPDIHRLGPGAVDHLIVGDHLEAIAELTKDTDVRAGITDLRRRRDFLVGAQSGKSERASRLPGWLPQDMTDDSLRGAMPESTGDGDVSWLKDR